MSDKKFLKKLDELLESLDWDKQPAARIDRDIQTIVLRALDIYLAGKGPRPPLPHRRLERFMSGKGPRPPLPHEPLLLFALSGIAAMHHPGREHRDIQRVLKTRGAQAL